MPCGDQSCGFNHVIHCLFKRCETSRNSCLGTAVVLTQKYVFLSPFRLLFVTNKYLLSLGVQYYLQLLATVDLECKDGKTSESTSQSFFFFLYHPSCFASRKQSYVTCVTYLCLLILHESYHYSKPNHSVIWNLTLVHLLGTNTALSHFTFYIHGSKCTDMFKCLTYGLMCLSNHEHTGSPYHRPKWKTTGTLLFCNSW